MIQQDPTGGAKVAIYLRVSEAERRTYQTLAFEAGQSLNLYLLTALREALGYEAAKLEAEREELEAEFEAQTSEEERLGRPAR